MHIGLKRLTLQNFKGILDFTLEPQGQHMVVRGDNATGKTTLFDAVQFLLFGKDSHGRSDFQIKTVDENGQELSGLDHAVEAVLDVDGRELTLKKVFRENWSKKRGATKKTLTGHKTDHYVDGVPKKKKEFESTVSNMVEEETFKFLTSPFYYASLHWQKRRDILLEVCGDVADQEVIESNADLAKLPDLLGNRSMDDHKKVVAGRKREIAKQLEQLPARIDELQRSISEAEQYSRHLVKEEIKELEKRLEDMKAGGQEGTLKQEKWTLMGELSRLQNEREKELRSTARALESELDDLRRRRSRLSSQVKEMQDKISHSQDLISRHEKKMERLRQQYKELPAQAGDIETICPTCGQDLPEDQVERARAKHNQDLALKKKEIQEEGKALKKQVEKLQSEIEGLQKGMQDHERQVESIDVSISHKQAELETENQRTTASQDVEISKAEERIKEIDHELARLESEKPDTSKVEQQIQEERKKLSAIDAAKKTKERIQELKDEEKKLSAEYEDVENQTVLMEAFIKTKVELLEEKINSRFDLARFKMFTEQINEGLKETCEIMYQGVPFHTGLNRGAQTNVGLDIIKTLSEHYGVKAPVFVDNAEAVTDLIDPGTQTIKLVVDGRYQELTIETESQYKEASNG